MILESAEYLGIIAFSASGFYIGKRNQLDILGIYIASLGKADQNFDPLIEKFKTRIYGTHKGTWRLTLLKEDLGILHSSDRPLDIWDAGCGLGQLSLWFAQAGHKLTCCDISYKMITHTKEQFAHAGEEATFYKTAAQELAPLLPPQDLVLFHAVIEWLSEPLETLKKVSSKVKPKGHLSLLFYNYHSFIYRNALRGGWRIPFLLDRSAWYGKGKKLTPPHPFRGLSIFYCIIWV